MTMSNDSDLSKSVWRGARARWQSLTERADRVTGGLLSVLRLAAANYAAHDCSIRAAAIAYYVVLSFFPLVVLLIVLGSSFLTQDHARDTVFTFVDRYLPGANQLVQLNIEQLLRNRGAASVLSILGLVWSGSNVFASIHRSLNDILGTRERPSYWWQRLLGVASVGAVLVLFALSFVATALGQLIDSLPHALFGLDMAAYGQLWRRIAALVGVLPTILFVFTIYRLLSASPLRWWELVPGSIFAALLWEVAKQLFTRYVTSFRPYNLVYGSLGKLIAFVIWSYMSGAILLLGAELTVAWKQVRRSRRVRRDVVRLLLQKSFHSGETPSP
jgi:membrane protein